MFAEAFRSHDDHYGVRCLEFRRSSRLPRHGFPGEESLEGRTSNRRRTDVLHMSSPVLNLAATEHLTDESTNRISIYQNLSKDAQIGVGSFGKVYRMTSKTDGRSRFAIKIVPKHHKNLPNEVVLSRIHDEVDILRTLQSCPETVRLVDVTEDGQQVYIVMELCEGGDLLHFLKEHGPMTEWEAAHTAESILRLLCESHRQGILYADLKPNNILLKRRYMRMRSCHQSLQLRIADFGCSQRLQGGAFNMWAGTPAFMAPEVFKRQRGMESDQWSLGMVMYQLLTGRLPFWGPDPHPSPFRVMAAILKDEVRFDGPEWRGISAAARDFVRRLLERDPVIRMSAEQALAHPWIKRHCDTTHGVPPFANNAVPAVRKVPQA